MDDNILHRFNDAYKAFLNAISNKIDSAVYEAEVRRLYSQCQERFIYSDYFADVPTKQSVTRDDANIATLVIKAARGHDNWKQDVSTAIDAWNRRLRGDLYAPPLLSGVSSQSWAGVDDDLRQEIRSKLGDDTTPSDIERKAGAMLDILESQTQVVGNGPRRSVITRIPRETNAEVFDRRLLAQCDFNERFADEDGDKGDGEDGDDDEYDGDDSEDEDGRGDSSDSLQDGLDEEDGSFVHDSDDPDGHVSSSNGTYSSDVNESESEISGEEDDGIVSEPELSDQGGEKPDSSW